MASPWLLTGNVGTNPSADFVGTTDNQPLVIKSGSGKVGIGTETPVASLDVGSGVVHVAGATNPTTTEQGAYLGWNALTGGTGETDFINNQGLGTGGFAFMNTPPSGTPRSTVMVITGGGDVGIGTSTPVSQLDVRSALASPVCIQLQTASSAGPGAAYFIITLLPSSSVRHIHYHYDCNSDRRPTVVGVS